MMTAQETAFPPGKYQLRVADYLQLQRSGAFGGARTQLIEGDVIITSPQFRPRGIVKMKLYDQLRDALLKIHSPLLPVVEFSLALSDTSLPEPDIMLTSEPAGDGPVLLASVALVIEVADATLAEDLGTMARIYAAAGIAEYWVADVNGKVIHQLWASEGETYAQRREVPFGERIEAVTVAGLTISL
jgi:Uma2 family endonuclease